MIETKERPKMVEHAFLVGIQARDSAENPHALLDELAELVRNMGVAPTAREVVRLREPQPRFLIGAGKAEALANRAKAEGCDCIIFDVELSPSQQRNWEVLSGVTVIDRHEVILDIFSSRAQTKEANLQVELARAEYALPRLKNAWSHLSRQRGGGGITQRGEGEAQIELDSRIVRQRIASLKTELAAVVRHREVQRKRRLRVPLPTAAIVGYTNAGKSSLLNVLTGSTVLSANKLFATLDPTTRQLILPAGEKILVTDTVGFVRKLPHRLVEAFKATLEEAVVADFLIHVLDATSPEVEEHRATTMGVLKELGADSKRIITVYNKADLLADKGKDASPQAASGPDPTSGGDASPEPSAASPDHIDAFFARLEGRSNGTAYDPASGALLTNGGSHARHDDGIYVSAKTGQGLDQLRLRMQEMLEDRQHVKELLVPHGRYDIIGKLHAAGCVKTETPEDAGVRLVCNLPDRLLSLATEFGV